MRAPIYDQKTQLWFQRVRERLAELIFCQNIVEQSCNGLGPIVGPNALPSLVAPNEKAFTCWVGAWRSLSCGVLISRKAVSHLGLSRQTAKHGVSLGCLLTELTDRDTNLIRCSFWAMVLLARPPIPAVPQNT